MGYGHYTYPPNMMCSSLQVKRLGILTLHIPSQHNVLKSPSLEVGVGYGHYTYPPTQHDVLISRQARGGGMDITHTPNMMCSSLQVKRLGGELTLHIPPQHDVLKSPSQEVGDMDITHTPQHDVLKSPSQEVGGGGIDITHTPNMMCSSLQVKRWEVLKLHPMSMKDICINIW